MLGYGVLFHLAKHHLHVTYVYDDVTYVMCHEPLISRANEVLGYGVLFHSAKHHLQSRVAVNAFVLGLGFRV